MYFLRIALVLIAALALLSPARAADAPCFGIVSAVGGAQPDTMVMIDKCNGTTWMLVKVGLPPKPNDPHNYFTWHWQPIATVSVFPELSYPTLNELQHAQ